MTYVTVEDDNDNDEWVTFAAVAGYTGVMVAWGCAVWGSGYYYPPYYGWGGGYPYYYPHYPTYGYGASYNPWTGAYGAVGGGVRSLWRRGRVGALQPADRAPTRAAPPPGVRTALVGAGAAYNPRTGAYGATRQGSGVYGSWGSTAVARGDDWAQHVA